MINLIIIHNMLPWLLGRDIGECQDSEYCITHSKFELLFIVYVWFSLRKFVTSSLLGHGRIYRPFHSYRAREITAGHFQTTLLK